MAKSTKKTATNENTTVVNSTNDDSRSNNGGKMKRTRRSVPRDSPLQRSSIYRGVTRHRWTGRYEAHLWDKNCWNESQNKKGKQVYLGAYDDEEAAARAYDLAALKYWGCDTILNFPLSTYEEELKEMEGQSKEEYIGSLRRYLHDAIAGKRVEASIEILLKAYMFTSGFNRKSSGFSRGVSKYRGVARHHHNGRWEARIGRVFGNKYLYLGTYATQEEAAIAYDMAAIEYRGLNAVTNFDLSRYIKWLRPNHDGSNASPTIDPLPNSTSTDHAEVVQQSFHQHQQSVGEISQFPEQRASGVAASSALGLLLQSTKFKEMLERTSAASGSSSSPKFDSKPSRCSFPDDIQTYFECHDGGSYNEGDDAIFGDLHTFTSSLLEFELDV